jgi:hypothetical protein
VGASFVSPSASTPSPSLSLSLCASPKGYTAQCSHDLPSLSPHRPLVRSNLDAVVKPASKLACAVCP